MGSVYPVTQTPGSVHRVMKRTSPFIILLFLKTHLRIRSGMSLPAISRKQV